jgi:Peptidase family M48
VNLDTAAELREHYSAAYGIAIGSTAAAASLAAIGRLIWATARAMAMAGRRRARHDETLALVARPGPLPGMVVLDNDRPLVYCLPGRGRVVVTSGALSRLNHAQLQAVLAHERAHLPARHHLVIMLARVLPDALPGIRFLATAADQIGRTTPFTSPQRPALSLPRAVTLDPNWGLSAAERRRDARTHNAIAPVTGLNGLRLARIRARSADRRRHRRGPEGLRA